MSHRGPVTHHPGDLELTRREGLKGLTGAEDPAPKGLEILSRYVSPFMLGRAETRPLRGVEKDAFDVHLIPVSQNKDALLRRGIWNWKSGTKGVPVDICP